jgi:hypothetical protein
MKMAVFWVVAPCRAFALMLEAARTTETLENFYQTTRRYNPEDSHLHTYRRENLKSYFSGCFAINFPFERKRKPKVCEYHLWGNISAPKS